MNGGHPDDSWQPATSSPGELYTPEGSIRATGNFWRNLKRGRRTREQRAMVRTGGWIVLIGIPVIVLIAIVSSLF